MSSLDLESKAISLFCNVSALSKMYAIGLREVQFDKLKTKEAFNFAVEYWKESGFEKAPTKEILEAKVDDLTVYDTDESPVFVAKEIKRQYIKRQIKDRILDSVDEINDDPVAALSSISNSLWRIKKLTKERRNESNLVDDIQERRKLYIAKAARAEKGIIGESIGFDEVDEAISGIRPGELFVLAGGPKVGKTWSGLQIVKRAMEHKKTVVFFTLEMSVNEVVDRLEALLSGVSYNRLDKGKLSTGELNRLREVQDKEKTLGKVYIRKPPYGERTVENMIRIAKDVKADIMVIDQLSFIEGKNARGRSEEIAQIVLDLKSSISEDEDFMIPTVLLAQFNRAGAAAGEQADAGSLALSSEIERSADCILSVSQSKEQKTNNAIVMQILICRRAEPAKFLIHREFYDKTDFTFVRQIPDIDE